jgi:hypothetical protein
MKDTGEVYEAEAESDGYGFIVVYMCCQCGVGGYGISFGCVEYDRYLQGNTSSICLSPPQGAIEAELYLIR